MPLGVRNGGVVQGKVFPKQKQHLENFWCIYQKHTAAKTTFDYTVQQHA